MNNTTRINIKRTEYTVQGILLGILPLTWQELSIQHPWLTDFWLLVVVSTTVGLLLTGCSVFLNTPRLGKLLMFYGMTLSTLVIFFECQNNPLLTLLYALPIISIIYHLTTHKIVPATELTGILQLHRLGGLSFSLLLLTVFSPLFAANWSAFPLIILTGVMLLWGNIIRYTQITSAARNHLQKLLLFILMPVTFLLLANHNTLTLPAALLAAVVLIIVFRKLHTSWQLAELLVQHPARCLMLTFLILCAAGTLLLRTPWAMMQDLPVIDAAFTAVSAACVTGLSTIDIAEDLTFTGRAILLILIQLGGLGIMTLTTLALHMLGKLTLNQEQLMHELAPVQQQDIFYNLRLVVNFTFIVESIGAALLSWGFYSVHHNLPQALELGIFTSVSAFCNAGFFPGSSNLVPYAGESLLLIIIALEIVLGGIAPIVSCSFLRIRSIRRLSFFEKLCLQGTFILLAGSTFLMLLFEWRNSLADLSLPDKLVNGFFQAVTLRTAGFNTVELATVQMPTYLFMLIFMFIGGCPGGTAGGIKVTTLAVLFFILRAAIRKETTVCADQRRIAPGTVIQAPAILTAALLVLFAVIIMLATTQLLPMRELCFEAVSALATVGLSLGITTELDTVGRIIIMAAMFIGRIGPLTLFLLFSERHSNRIPGYPPVNIPLG